MNIRNYLKIAWRNLRKDGQFSMLNLAGLSIGLACTLLIYLWVTDEWSVDKFHSQSDRLYAVMYNISNGDGSGFTTESTPPPLAEALKAYPEVKDIAVIHAPDKDDGPKGVLSVGGKSIKAGELFVTPNFFDLFSFHAIAGNLNGVMLSEDMATRLFRNADSAIGRTVKWDRGTGQPGVFNGLYTVTGVFADPPANSSLQFDILFPYANFAAKDQNRTIWGSSSPFTYLLLKDGVDASAFSSKLKEFVRAQFKPEEKKWAGTLFLQRFTDLYLYNHYTDGAVDGGRISYLRLFGIIALFILGIACINFMTLSTARAAGRAKEVGIKKVVGATRVALIAQYLVESLLMALVSLGIAMVLVGLLLPAFNVLTDKHMRLHFDTGTILTVIGITVLTGLVAGSYPALYLSGFRPAMALKNRFNSGGASRVRRGLVVFQFTLSLVLIVTVIGVYRQMRLIQTKDLGYTRDHIIRIASEGNLQKEQRAFLQAVRSIPGVLGAADMEGDLLGNMSGGGGIDWPGKKQRIDFSGLYIDFGIMDLLGLKMAAGRSFSPVYATDSDGVIFNETAIAMMGLKDPMGQSVKLWGEQKHIIGIVKDFHYESLYKRIGPMFLSYRKNTASLLIKYEGRRQGEVLAAVRDYYGRFNPGVPLEYTFMDEDYRRLYVSEERVAVLSRYFAGLAILISCLGLFGLAAFTAQKRQKEIGVRKVVGASVRQIVFLLSAEFLKLVALAVVISIPVSWWMVEKWLQGFAYRQGLTATVFAEAGIGMLTIAFITVAVQTVKAARMNPVEALRSE
jgi:putative ABC transport system permease protein